jgi:hypothetical protein
MLSVKASMFHCLCIILNFKKIVAKMLAAEKWSHLSTFERFSTLCHTLQSCTCSTPSCYNQGWIKSADCAVTAFSLALFRQYRLFTKSWKIKGVP